MGAGPVEERSWTILLNYAEEDEPCADVFYNYLRNANLTVWSKRREVLLGQSYLDRMEEALKKSQLLLLLVSQKSAMSNRVKAVLEPKMIEQIDGKNVAILPVSLDNTDPKEVSIYLQDRKWIKIPCQGSEEEFTELLDSIEALLKERGILRPSDSLSKPHTPPTSQNPYGWRIPVPADRFIVHEDLVKSVTRKIVEGQSVAITGAKMMGKSSLLNFLASPQCETYYQKWRSSRFRFRFVYLDLRELIAKTRDELILKLAREVSTAVSGPFEGDTYEKAQKWLQETTGKRNAGGSLWIFLLDEFDQIVELEGVDKAFFESLSSLAKNHSVCYVIASSRKLNDLRLPQSVKSSCAFFLMFDDRPLKVWDELTAAKLIFKPYGKKLRIFNEADSLYIMRYTANHPALLELACEQLFEMRITDKNKVTGYDELLRRYVEKAQDIYEYYWYNEINESEQEWLQQYWQVLHEKDEDIAQRDLQWLTSRRDYETIRRKFIDLGLLLNKTVSLEIPKGFDVLIRKMLKR